MQTKFSIQELPLAAFLKAHGYEPQVVPPEEPAGYCRFSFDPDPAELARLAEEFVSGASVPALVFYQSLNVLKNAIHYARRGGWR